jgi:hypothetical protein
VRFLINTKLESTTAPITLLQNWSPDARKLLRAESVLICRVVFTEAASDPTRLISAIGCQHLLRLGEPECRSEMSLERDGLHDLRIRSIKMGRSDEWVAKSMFPFELQVLERGSA